MSIRPGWFWHAREDARVKTPHELLELYYRSVGRGGCLLLNVPPDRRGLIRILRLFGRSLACYAILSPRTSPRGAQVTASNVRRTEDVYDPRHLLDGDRYTYWATDDGVNTAEVVIALDHDVRFDAVRIRENIRLGQRLEALELDRWENGAWKRFASATSIGACRLIRT